MPFTAWKQEERNRHRDRKTDLFSVTSGGFVIIVKQITLLMTVKSIQTTQLYIKKTSISNHFLFL